MNRFPVLIFALAAFSSVPLGAQQPGTRSQEPTQTTAQQSSPSPDPQQSNAPAVPVPSTANSPEVANPQLRPVTGELESKLDTTNAKTGDSVVLKTTEKASTASGVVIPKGSKIVGHVTDVEAKGKSSDNSRVIVQFDQAELKGGQSMPIKSVLQALEPASASGAADGYAGTAAGGPAAAGGINAGGTSGANSGASSGSGVSGRSGPESGGPATSTASGAPAVGTIVARNGNVAIRTTAIPGVLLANNADGQPFSNASGALLGARQDIHLDTGTHVVVAIAEANTKNSR